MVVTWTAIEKKIWPLWNYCILLPFTFEAIVLPSSSCLTKKRTNPSSKFAIEVMMIPHINEKAQGNLDLVEQNYFSGFVWKINPSYSLWKRELEKSTFNFRVYQSWKQLQLWSEKKFTCGGIPGSEWEGVRNFRKKT